MTKRLFILFIILFSITCLNAQKKYTISGLVKDNNSGEYLIGTNVFIKEILSGCQTNQYGFYSLTVPEGNYDLTVSFLGYVDTTYKIKLYKNIKLDIALNYKSVTTKEVVITAEGENKNIKSNNIGTVQLSIEKIKTFAATVITANHEIKQPLTLINLSTAAIRREFSKTNYSSENILKRIEFIENAAKDIISVLDKLGSIKKPVITPYVNDLNIIDLKSDEKKDLPN